jgi:signal transduction histidine kinase
MIHPREFRWRWTDLPLRQKGLIVVAIPLLPLLVMGALVYASQRRADEADRMVTHALEVKAAIDRTQMLLVEAELGARGYLVSRSADTLELFRAANAAVPGAIQRLTALVRDPEQVERLKRLPVLAQGRPLTSIVDYVDATSAGAPMPLDLLERNRDTMSALRTLLREMQHAEDVLLEARTMRAREARRGALLATAGGVALGLAGGIVAAILFTSGIGGRVAIATANARRLSSGEPLAPMATARDEVGDLSASLIAASALLQERDAELKRRIAELAAANGELEAFSYSVSHDLRAPLRHVAGFATLLKKRAGDALDEEGKRYLETITGAAARMGRLIDDLLAFSRMGRAEMMNTRVNLDEIVEDVIRNTREDTTQRRIKWTTHPLPSVAGDPALLRLAFENLVSNAIKYTAPRPVAEIEIGARPSVNGERVVYIRDNGVGFDMAYADKLFGVFQRLHTADQFDGTGIGLANVRRIVQRHGGRAWAEGAIDRGATFFVALPQEGRAG